MWARISSDGVVAELTDTDPAGRFHPSLTWIPLDSNANVSIGDIYAKGEFQRPEPKQDDVPSAVSRFQARAALRQAGLRSRVEEIISDPETDPLVTDAWHDAQEFRRNSHSLSALADAIGLSNEEVDNLFRQAALIEA